MYVYTVHTWLKKSFSATFIQATSGTGPIGTRCTRQGGVGAGAATLQGFFKCQYFMQNNLISGKITRYSGK